MQFGTKKALILALSVASSLTFLLETSNNAWASRKLIQQVRTSDVERTISANESLLNRFILEREQLLKSPERTTSPHIHRNKLTIINNKITFLEQEIKRTKPRLQKNKPAATKKPIIPISIGLKKIVMPEPRNGYLLAYSSTFAKFLPRYTENLRDPPEQGVLQMSVNPIASLVQEARLSASQAIMPEKIKPIAITALPLREAAQQQELEQKPLPISAIANVDTEVRRYFPSSGEAPDQSPMAILKPVETEKAKVRTAKTGRDWKSMTDAEKEIYILSVMGNLSRRDVFLMKSYDFYIKAVNKSVTDDPSLEAEYVHKILMNNAYASEPESRKDLEKVWR